MHDTMHSTVLAALAAVVDARWDADRDAYHALTDHADRNAHIFPALRTLRDYLHAKTEDGVQSAAAIALHNLHQARVTWERAQDGSSDDAKHTAARQMADAIDALPPLIQAAPDTIRALHDRLTELFNRKGDLPGGDAVTIVDLWFEEIGMPVTATEDEDDEDDEDV